MDLRNKIDFSFHKTDIGSYNLGVANNVACVVFMRTNPNKRFSLKETLKKHLLKPNGKYEVAEQFCFYNFKTVEQMWLPKNILHERWMRLWRKPLTKEILTTSSKMLQGPQQNIDGHIFECAVTKIFVPIR